MFGIANAAPKNVLVQGIVQKELRRVAERYLRGRLIDVGCGTKPYAALLRPYVGEHVGVDHRDTMHDVGQIDLFGTAYEIPVDPDSFDCALYTAVLEHLEEPERALRECHRVLKSGGIAVFTVPFIWHIHEAPRDFYRFSRYALEYLLDKTGFQTLELKALSGFWVTFGQLLVYNLYRFNRGPLRWLRLVDLMGLAIQGLAALLDRFDKAEDWTWMYLVVARKG